MNDQALTRLMLGWTDAMGKNPAVVLENFNGKRTPRIHGILYPCLHKRSFCQRPNETDRFLPHVISDTEGMIKTMLATPIFHDGQKFIFAVQTDITEWNFEMVNCVSSPRRYAILRVMFVLHPVGYDFTGRFVMGYSPTNAELTMPTNWHKL